MRIPSIKADGSVQRAARGTLGLLLYEEGRKSHARRSLHDSTSASRDSGCESER